ncbi:VOC family protein [uncultured Cohaesibacter sp.]|uniref:VOC family protein n=1 Tax=uncultured Cohaesibacter sp. TaxID=1002546 RepID=UPI002AAAD469|nr:VOC family protein [uncultured Cohaesibacter sp.]
MRLRGINHVEFSVLDYDKSIAFYDQMFGWLGYKSFWTLDVGYRSTYYMARFPMPHSYIGIQPAKSGEKFDFPARPVGVHHIALWAKNRKEVDAFHKEFLMPNHVPVTETPAEYPLYAPGYYATFFDDPINGIHWELAHIPRLPSLGAIRNWRKAMKDEEARHPEWKHPFSKESERSLPPRKR